MDSRNTRCSTSLCLAICLLGGTSLSAQIQGQPKSIVTHSTIQPDADNSFGMLVSSKGSKYIRASIRNQKKTAGADIIYDGKAVAVVERGSLQKHGRPRVLSGEEAATNLFDLIAINPEYHFKNIDGFNLNIPTFKAYRVELQTEALLVEETERYRPVKALLYKEHDAGSTLVRSIEYMEFFDQTDPYFQPKKISFTDVKTGDIGHITIDKIEYNIGLPSFLFEIRGNTDK